MNRRGLLAAGAAGSVLATPNLANAQPQVLWRSAGSFPKSTDVLWGVQEMISRRVAELTGGAFQIRAFAAGELVPALQVMDAVGGGTVESGYTAAYYYIGKDPSLGFGTEMPFGMNARQHLAWIHQGGGREMMEEVYRDQGVIALPASNTGAQMGGWFRKEMRTVQDLSGLKFRIGGTGGMVLAKLGVIAQQLGAPDIYPSLERGVIDGAEWVGPHDDEKLGFNRVASFYYYPGWWEPCSEGDFIINTKAWEALPKAYQQVLEAVVRGDQRLVDQPVRPPERGGAAPTGRQRGAAPPLFAGHPAGLPQGDAGDLCRARRPQPALQAGACPLGPVPPGLAKLVSRGGGQQREFPLDRRAELRRRAGEVALPGPSGSARRHADVAQLDVVVRGLRHLHALPRRPDDLLLVQRDIGDVVAAGSCSPG